MKKTKAELIRDFNLTKTSTKCYFSDGLAHKCRTLYMRNNSPNSLYVFYDNDLHYVELYKGYSVDMEEVQGRLCGAYSWYH